MTRASRSCRQGQIAVKIVHVMVMILTVIIKMDMKITAVDARFLYSAYLYEKTVRWDRVQRFLKSVRIRPKSIIAATNISPLIPDPQSRYNFYPLLLPLSASLLICVATYPAPKPLSIFTVTMPFAQELIIVKRADSP